MLDAIAAAAFTLLAFKSGLFALYIATCLLSTLDSSKATGSCSGFWIMWLVDNVALHKLTA